MYMYVCTYMHICSGDVLNLHISIYIYMYVSIMELHEWCQIPTLLAAVEALSYVFAQDR